MATTDWLLLRIPPTGDAPLSWALVDAEGQLLAAPDSGNGENLAQLAAGRRVALLVPGFDVTLFQTSLPAGNEARQMQLVPFALEDQVSQDIDLLHFAIGSRSKDGTVSVATVERSLMQQWLERAQALNLVPHAVFAESDLAPTLPGHVTMLVAEGQLWLRNDGQRPLLLPADDPALALEMLLGGSPLSTVNLAVYSTPEEWSQHGQRIEAMRDQVASFKVQLATGGLLSLFASAATQGSPINLLQGAFRPKRTGGPAWQQWRWAAVLVGALVLLHGIGSFWQLHQLRQASQKVRQDINQLYSTLYPGKTPDAEPRRFIEKQLAGTAGGGQQGDLLHLLAAVAAAKQNVPLAQLQSAVFEAGSLKMKLRAPDGATLDKFNQALRAGGYKAEVVSSSTHDGNFEGQVELKSAGA